MKIVLVLTLTLFLVACARQTVTSPTPVSSPTATVATATTTKVPTPTPTAMPTLTPTAGVWYKVFQVNESQTHNNVVVTILSVGVSTPQLLLPAATDSKLKQQGLDEAKTVVGIQVKVENRSSNDVAVYPGGIDAALLVGNEQVESILFGVDIGAQLMAGATQEFQVIFPLKRTELAAVQSFRYKFRDFDFQVSLEQ